MLGETGTAAGGSAIAAAVAVWAVAVGCLGEGWRDVRGVVGAVARIVMMQAVALCLAAIGHAMTCVRIFRLRIGSPCIGSH